MASALSAPAVAKDKFPKQIKFVIGTGTGGGFDKYGRLTARYMKKHLPGNPTVIVQNMPGAGGIKSLSWLATAAPRDGSAVAIMSSSAVFAPIQGLSGATYDATKFNYLISLDRLSNMLIVWHTTPYKSAKDAFEKRIIIANASGSTAVYPAMFNRLLGTKFKVVTGYKGTNRVLMALERGEGEGAFNLSWSTIVTKRRLLDKKLIRVLMQLTFDPINDPRLAGVPSLNDFIKEGIEKNLLEILLAKQEVGRAIIAPQNMPTRLVRTYRKGLMKAVSDPDYRADAKKRRIRLKITPGKAVEAFVKRIYAMPKSTVKRLRDEIKLAQEGVKKRKK
jgi:tripartite-type tricarboxylate transporter receptor subunit TctC